MLLDHLQTLARRITGTRAIALVGTDGIPIEALSHDDTIDIETLAAEIVALARAIRDNHRELEVGPLASVGMDLAKGRVFLSSLAADVYLLLVADGREIGGKLRHELRRAPLLFLDDLT